MTKSIVTQTSTHSDDEKLDSREISRPSRLVHRFAEVVTLVDNKHAHPSRPSARSAASREALTAHVVDDVSDGRLGDEESVELVEDVLLGVARGV